MSWTGSPLSLPLAARGGDSGACAGAGLSSPAPMTPVASSPRPITTATTPPRKPEMRLEPIALSVPDAGDRRLKGAAARMRGEHDQTAQAGERPAARGERAAQLPALTLPRRRGLAGRRVAQRAQAPDVAGG